MPSDKVALMRLILYARTEANNQGEMGVSGKLDEAAVELVERVNRKTLLSRINELQSAKDELLLEAVSSHPEPPR